MSLAFALDHRPGTLLEALGVLQKAQVNLTRIESRPVPGRPWEYIFFIDLGFEDREAVERALERLREVCREVQVLGVYRAANASGADPVSPDGSEAADQTRQQQIPAG